MIKLFIFGFPKDMEDSWFIEMFGQFGDVKQITIVKDYTLSNNLGYGFIIMKDYECAMRAITALNDSYIDGHFVSVRIAQ